MNTLFKIIKSQCRKERMDTRNCTAVSHSNTRVRVLDYIRLYLYYVLLLLCRPTTTQYIPRLQLWHSGLDSNLRFTDERNFKKPCSSSGFPFCNCFQLYNFDTIQIPFWLNWIGLNHFCLRYSRRHIFLFFNLIS